MIGKRTPSGRAQRSGFALMAALWLVVIIGVTGYELSVRSRTRRLAVANALETPQAAAAADAALETTIRLGNERAIARAYDAGSRLQINRATEADVRRLLVALHVDASQADRLAQRILDWRDPDAFRRGRGAERADYLRGGTRTLPSDADIARIDELRDVEGVTAGLFDRMAPYLSVLGTGQINLNSASPAVLGSLPGLGTEATTLIIRAQASMKPFRSLDELMNQLSPGGRAALMDAGVELTQRVTFGTREVVVESEGWLDGSPVRVRGEALYVKGGDALFSVWRRIGL